MGNIASARSDHAARGIELPGHAKAAMHDSGKVIARETAIPPRRAALPMRACRRAGDRGRPPTGRAAAIRTGRRAKAPQGWRCSCARCRENCPVPVHSDGGQQEVAASQTRVARRVENRAHSSHRTTPPRRSGVCAESRRAIIAPSARLAPAKSPAIAIRVASMSGSQPTAFDERDRLEHVFERRGERMFRREPVIDAEHRATGFDREVAHGAVMGVDGAEGPSAAVHEHDDAEARRRRSGRKRRALST